MTIRELRASWILLGLLLGFVLAYEPRFAWYAVACVPWMLGLGFLLPNRTATVIGSMSSRLVADRAVRIALLVLGVLVLVVAHIFTVVAALLVTTWFSACLLLLAATGRADLLRASIVGIATSSVTVCVALLSLEFVFRTRSISTNLGLPSEIAAWETRYDRLWERNVFGFRSRHEEVHKPTGVFRIVTLGDSFTWGDKIAETDSTWPAILETALARDAGADRIEVISLAQRGYTTANEAELLQRLGWQFNPDLVIIQFFANDGLPSGPDFQSVGGEWLCPQHNLVPVRFRTELVQHSAIIGFLEVQYNALRSSQPCYLQFHQLYDSSSATFAQFHSALGAIGDSARARRTPTLMLLFPFFAPGEWTIESYPLRAVHEQVASMAREEGLWVVDLVPYFAAEGGDWRRWWATRYDSHPNSRAHRLVAAVLADSILGGGLLAQPPEVRLAAPR
ncbi:MAG: hypothetical protein AMS18_14255 [Gemmatimonas sp. SG8_17]|nr:MAG: hypothetical protein AMS18_14255 [Gemmatimonas sp. SG8_17]